MDPKVFWVGFNKIRGIGSVKTRKLLKYFGDLSVAWTASENALLEAGLNPKAAKSFIQVRVSINLDDEYNRILEKGIQVVTINDENYPQKLKTIEQPPPVLYIKGSFEDSDNFAVAIVGTRHLTAYGRQVTIELSSLLARNGITVISGLARGIDSIAHDATLDAGGRTLAVLGCGVDIVYPPEHRALSQRIQEQGALVSDYYPGTLPEGINFPPRNRIISGLSLASVIIEAGEKSGALITAEFAANQGREVFAVPGSIYAPRSKGTNRLIRDGALPLTDFNELLAALDLTQVEEYRYAKKVIQKDEVEELLSSVIKEEPLHIDEIKTATGLSMEKVSAALVMMELKGIVRKVGNLTYISIGDDMAQYEVE
ncbi:MAG: DNA-processing protein DprA [Pelolinea sp.]|nr:DNA-processing protein DprA [Pelolinea sp.]